MAIPAQRGFLTDAVRRFLGIVGSYTGAVDGIIVPTVRAARLDVQPYRQGVAEISRRVNAGGAANNSCWISAEALPAGALVVREVHIRNPNAATVEYGVGSWFINIGAAGASILAENKDLNWIAAAPSVVAKVPVTISQTTQALAVYPSPPDIAILKVQPSTTVVVPINAVLYPSTPKHPGLQNCIGVWDRSAAPPAAQVCEVTWYGTYYNDPSIVIP